MSIRSEREKSKMQEKYQMILAQMLKEDDNRFCADCDTKSPRWASWNLGIFICIRCAGFHRNLGVHISKVKSVNLDSWTAEQIASMQAMGNNRARAVYEANLPAGFRRPQADSALESFIRAKYEQRKWIAKEWIPPEITVSSDLIESETNQRRAETPTEAKQPERASNNSNNIPKIKSFAAPVTASNPVRQAGHERSAPANQPSMTPSPSATSISAPVQPAAAAAAAQPSLDLLGLDEPLPSVAPPIAASSTKPSATNVMDPLHEIFASAATTHVPTGSAAPTSLDNDLQSAFLTSTETGTTAGTSGPMSNDRIMALFNTPQTSMAATAGANMRPPAMQLPPMNMPGFPHAQAHQLHSHQKSASFGSNLYQQPALAGSQHGFQSQQGQPFPNTPTMGGMQHHNNSTPTLQNPPSAFTHEQLNNQFSQFVPFANSKTNTSASALISGLPTRPVTDYMPASSSDLLWQ